MGRRRAQRRTSQAPMPAAPPRAAIADTRRLLVLAGAAFVLKAMVLAQLADHPLLQPRGGPRRCGVRQAGRAHRRR